MSAAGICWKDRVTRLEDIQRVCWGAETRVYVNGIPTGGKCTVKWGTNTELFTLDTKNFEKWREIVNPRYNRK